jgi:hypothetical protein
VHVGQVLTERDVWVITGMVLAAFLGGAAFGRLGRAALVRREMAEREVVRPANPVVAVEESGAVGHDERWFLTPPR